MAVIWSASPVLASEQSCKGTLLQIQVQESGTIASDRFRFSLELQAEASSKSAALALLRQRLDRVRQGLKHLALGSLTIPAPRSFSSGGADSAPRVEHASTSVRGEVSRGQYDALIQAAARVPGLRLQDMTALASMTGEIVLKDRLLKQALQKGSRQAKATAGVLGLSRIELLRINQRSGGIRPVTYEARTSMPRFRPEEAAQPMQSLILDLDYCLH